MKIVPVSKRIMKTVNVSVDDAVKIYKSTLLWQLASEFKGFFPNEMLCDEILAIQKKMKFNAKTGTSYLGKDHSCIYTIDNLQVEFQDVMYEISKKKVPKKFKNVEREIFGLCNKHDRMRNEKKWKITNTFHDILNKYWRQEAWKRP